MRLPAGITVEAHQSIGELDALRDEWNALSVRLRNELPFNTHDWMVAWWRHLRRANRWTRDSLCVLSFRRDGQLIAVAPYMVTSRHVLGVSMLRLLQPIGSDANLTEVRCLLVAPDDEQAVSLALVEYARDSVACDAVVIGLTGDSGAAGALLARRDVIESVPAEMFVIDLLPTWDALRASLPRNTRESLRKCRNSLTRDGHAATLDVAQTEDAITALLPRFFALHRSRASATGTTQHRDVFARGSEREFVSEVFGRLARQGRARLFTMEVAGEIIAMRLAIVCDDCLYLYYSGYDVAWSKYSVMTSVTSAAIQHAIDSGLARVNLSTGSDQSKLRWRPRTVAARTLVLKKPRMLARVVQHAIEVGRALRAKVEAFQQAIVSNARFDRALEKTAVHYAAPVVASAADD